MESEAVSRGLSRRPASASFLLRRACIAAGRNRLYFSGAVWYNILCGSFSNQRFFRADRPGKSARLSALGFRPFRARQAGFAQKEADYRRKA